MSTTPRAKLVCILTLLALFDAPTMAAQRLEVPAVARASDSALLATIPGLACRALTAYAEADRGTRLDNVFRLHIACEQFAEAAKALSRLREPAGVAESARSMVTTLPYAVYVEAKLTQARTGQGFEESLNASFRTAVGPLDDTTASYQVPWVLGTPLERLEVDLREAIDGARKAPSLTVADAVALIRRYVAVQVYRSLQSSLARWQEEDDRQRYLIDRDVPVRTPDGATVCALVVRPRGPPARRPSLLNFTIYADPVHLMAEARRTAAHGYAAVEGLTRGKGCSPDAPVPIEHDGADAAATIDWISRQEWSDGRVGMYGGSYEGFTQWAAAKHMPRALKALMPSVTFAPGVDFPMEGQVFLNYAYPWPLYTTRTKALDDATYGDTARWHRLNRGWYLSGRSYRELPRIDGAPNPGFGRWLDHPSYDAYWRGAVPYREEFARIGIPVLTTTGYYDSGQIGALYYFTEHHRYAPRAEHYLVIGPYDHVRGQRGTISPLGTKMRVLRGYELDSVAHLDIGHLRYEWFDYVFKGSPRPALLRDKVNYEVMGANVWRHASSLAGMPAATLRFHLSAERARSRADLITQTVDLADRSDVDSASPGGRMIDQALDDWPIVTRAPNIAHAISYFGPPLARPTEVSGLFSGRLDFIANKADFDFSVTLFELMYGGEYVQLSYYWARASYVHDRTVRRLLVPGARRQLTFRSGRVTSRRLGAGSRLVVVLGILKQPGEQINYGTGKDVSDETIADAGNPLHIQWLGSSFVDIPVGR